MMSTDRTAIRRRLAIRRTADRPPARTWKGAGHRSILAPLAATIAASVAVGVGRRHRPSGQGAPPRVRARARPRLGLLPGEGARSRAAAHGPGQVDMAIEMLEGAESADAAARRSTRRARRSSGFGRSCACSRASSAARRAAREDRALAATAACWPAPGTERCCWRRSTAWSSATPANSPAARAWRGCAAASRPSTSARFSARLGDPASRARALGELRALRERLLAWNLSDRQGIAVVEPGLLRLYSDGRRRWERCERRKGDATREMHLWRKRVKDLRYIAEMLEAREAAANGTPEPARAWQLGRVASRADALGELLGEDHDLAVLAELDQAQRQAPAQPRRAQDTAHAAQADRTPAAPAAQAGAAPRRTALPCAPEEVPAARARIAATRRLAPGSADAEDGEGRLPFGSATVLSSPAPGRAAPGPPAIRPRADPRRARRRAS